jgi:hypothetical protein
MATKKQKRALGEARQKANREASIAIGLKAQQRDRERREKKAKEAADKAREQQRKVSRMKVIAFMPPENDDPIDPTRIQDCDSVEMPESWDLDENLEPVNV